MESLTKNRQSLDTLRAMIERAYGVDQVPEGDTFASELSYGLFNAVYRICLRDGAEVVLKIAPPAGVPVLTREHQMMRNEIAAMALIERESTVPIPRVDFVDLSAELCDADFFFMEYVDALCFGIEAEAGDLPDDVVVAGHEHLGALNKDLNQIVGPHFGPLAGPGFATWREAATAMFGDVLADGKNADVDLGWDYDVVEGLFAAHAAVLDLVLVPRLVEVDLWAKNSMMREGRIVAIIDHERAMFGDPLMEAGLTGLDLPSFPDPAPFARGFGLTDLTPAERTRRHLYTLWLAVTMLVETTYRGQGPEQYRWACEQLDIAMALLGRSR
ncbi:Predicted kinase, aminoglycoside phosphotransferase (APT) family [Sanguibacter gelidistatuariae]|uniref:Predicted kinase, aminoglycoside phosphotransferase (APT) family n=1 Tax=Sanguibacter gelidistatuariae TaxID=1814289 RepID=A0A1G6XGF9_9MICO|nr:aminoglycoside phosphotransferase family protein [Sanguibacter gelidistatuariae]SDD77250.1 Predicted kinase, aminoglycoside phosphotransferase (APT) family [Sanguibacter gelidistatuariae]